MSTIMKPILRPRAMGMMAAALALCSGACHDRRPGSGPMVVYTPVERARSDSAAELMGVYSVDVDGRGNIYVADRWAIRVFAPNGRLVRSIGRHGRGPGEFGALASVAVMPGDSLYAYDGELNRATVFEPGTGRAAYTVQIGRDQAFAAWDVWRAHDGRSVAALFRAAYLSYAPAGFEQRKSVLRLFNADGSLRRDSVLAVPQPDYLVMNATMNGHSASGISRHPFGRTTLLAVSRKDRVVAAGSDSLKFEVYSLEGRHLKTVRALYPVSRRPVTAHERDSAVAQIAGMFPVAEVRRALAKHDLNTWPLVRDMTVDDDQDRIWASIVGGPGEPDHWVAFDMSGRPVARVDLSNRMRLRMVRGNTAYVAALDDNDVPQVLVYDLKPSGTLAMTRP
jgi:hypothetical protein